MYKYKYAIYNMYIYIYTVGLLCFILIHKSIWIYDVLDFQHDYRNTTTCYIILSVDMLYRIAGNMKLHKAKESETLSTRG